MYFKAVKDGKIVDVFSDEDIVYVHWHNHLNMFMRCYPKEQKDGVLSSDQSAIYVFEGRDGYDTVQLVEFYDDTEYASLKAEIESMQTPDYVEPDGQDAEEVDPDVLDNQQISAEEALRIIFGGDR